METFNIYINSELPFDDCAYLVRSLINANSVNLSEYQKEQKRYGENYGGAYYLFECLGIEFYFVKNEGEMFENEYDNFNYYLILNINEYSHQGSGLFIAEYINDFLASKKLLTKLEL
ncbi:MAG: hypothetical protein V4717_21140 [Bacteroidota bacterium]